MLTRTVADTAHALDVLGGYEVGDANWAPRPAEPYATAMRRDPGRLRIAVTAENPYGADVDPEAIEGLRVAAELLAALGHEVVEAAPAWPPPDVLEIFINVFGPAIALGINSGVLRAGRDPDEDEIEPLSRVLFERARATPSIGYLTAMAQLQALARGLVAFFADYDVLVTPALAERPLRDRRVQRARRASRCDDLDALRPLHALHGAVQRHRPARDLAAGRLRRRRAADRRADRRQAAQRGHAAPARGADRDGAPVGAPPPETTRSTTSSAGVTPSASAPAVPRVAEHLDGEQLRLVPGDERGRPGERLLGPQRGAQAGQRQRQRAAAAARRRRARAARRRAG